MGALENVCIFGIATAAVAAATAVTLAVLWPPLRPLLAELCGGRARGDAWATLISLCALLGATAASTLPDGALSSAAHAAHAADAGSATGDLRLALLGAAAQAALGLAGVLLSLFVTGGALFVYIRRTSACAPPEASVAAGRSTRQRAAAAGTASN